MYFDKVVLCASSAYEQKYYLNEDFKALPEQVKEELQIMCVLFTEDVGGILTLEFDEDGTLMLNVTSDEEDLLFDEINPSDMRQFEMAMSFYLYLNDFGDDYLEKNNYSRDEITEGIRSICKEYGVSSMVDFLF